MLFLFQLALVLPLALEAFGEAQPTSPKSPSKSFSTSRLARHVHQKRSWANFVLSNIVTRTYNGAGTASQTRREITCRYKSFKSFKSEVIYNTESENI